MQNHGSTLYGVQSTEKQDYVPTPSSSLKGKCTSFANNILFRRIVWLGKGALKWEHTFLYFFLLVCWFPNFCMHQISRPLAYSVWISSKAILTADAIYLLFHFRTSTWPKQRLLLPVLLNPHKKFSPSGEVPLLQIIQSTGLLCLLPVVIMEVHWLLFMEVTQFLWNNIAWS